VGASASHDQLLALLTRRQVLERASKVGLGALALSALPLVGEPATAHAATVSPTDATLQAFADTMIPGRKTTTTDLGNSVDPLAIAGVDPLPGAVEADALALFHHPELGFDALEPGFISELEARSLVHGGDFLHLDFDARVQVCLGGLDFGNPALLVWEAAAAVPFAAFCAATLVRSATAAKACGYRVMGLPGTAPNGYRDFSYRRRLNVERTRTGSLP
jgi:hypothetical protein